MSPGYQYTIDFGLISSGSGDEPFRVRIDAGALLQLIDDAAQASRIYELLLIERPGDIWDYLWVVPEQVSADVMERIARARKEAAPRFEDWPHPWPEDRLPYASFDALFCYIEDDCSALDTAWTCGRNDGLQAFVLRMFTRARAAIQELERAGPLVAHVYGLAQSGRHPFAQLSRPMAIQKARSVVATPARHSDAFYRKLDELLNDPELASVAYRGKGDYQVLYRLAASQRLRARQTGHRPGHALHISALINRYINNKDWDSEIWLFSEGLANGDLFIQEDHVMGQPLHKLVTSRYLVPGRWVLATEDQGELPNFEKTSGGGWYCYHRLDAVSRRQGLALIDWRRRQSGPPVLRFPNNAGAVYWYDKAVIVVGAEVDSETRAVLAKIIRAWECRGGDPLLIVDGPTEAFYQAGCRDLQDYSAAPLTTGWSRGLIWLAELLSRRRYWTDVIISLRAPTIVNETLSLRQVNRNHPWPLWVVASACSEALPVDLSLPDDLADAFNDAWDRAQPDFNL